MRRNHDGWWKVFGVLGFLIGIGMAIFSYLLYRKNQQYRDALISVSDQFPDEGQQARRAAWQSHHAPANQKTTEERLETQRIKEE
ncbi:MAG: hypothetical protein IKW60_04240 [Clostridia bacterium]|nr:hypothetical protein [Clostridia bacterium]